MSLLVDQLMAATLRRSDLGTVQGRLHFVRTVAKHIGRIPDNVTRGHYLLKVAEMTGLSVLTIRREAASR